MGVLDLDTAFRIHCGGATNFTRRMAVNIADDCMMGVREAVDALERAGKVKRGTWDWFAANGGITVKHIRQARDDRAARLSRAED